MGHKRIEKFEPVEVAKLRLRTLESVGEPLIPQTPRLPGGIDPEP